MASVAASAPGKIVLSGDYAVLEGAPALVMAVNRRAHARISEGTDEWIHVHAPDLDIADARARWLDGRLTWSTQAPRMQAKLRLVTAVLEGLAARGLALPPCRLALDTRAFFAGAGRGKLGLGSSAALTVALVGALCAHAGVATPALGEWINLHRAMQDGRGSGLDVATSRLGGLVCYRMGRGHEPPAAEVLEWPPGLLARCVWAGRPASTGSALQRLARWKADQPAACARHMDELVRRADTLAVACRMHDAPAVVDNVNGYATALRQLGEACGVDIVCAEHRSLSMLAAECGVAYKSCGAGGGDVGMALATDQGRLEHFTRRVAAAGFELVDVALDRHGLTLDTAADAGNGS